MQDLCGKVDQGYLRVAGLAEVSPERSDALGGFFLAPQRGAGQPVARVFGLTCRGRPQACSHGGERVCGESEVRDIGNFFVALTLSSHA